MKESYNFISSMPPHFYKKLDNHVNTEFVKKKIVYDMHNISEFTFNQIPGNYLDFILEISIVDSIKYKT